VLDATTGSPIQNARVLLRASAGPLPVNASVTISRSGSTATVSHTGHGLVTSDKVQIKGAAQIEYNGVHTITRIDDNSYSYTVTGTPATPATGTILCTFVAIEGLTDVDGEISATRSFGSDQPVSGVVRKGTAAPLYKTAPLSAVISSTVGASLTAQMVPDE
jgi:hypothetical protein